MTQHRRATDFAEAERKTGRLYPDRNKISKLSASNKAGEDMQHQRATRRAVLKSIAGGATGLFAVSFRPRGLRAQSAPALKFGRVPVNALVSNYIGPVDFFRDEAVGAMSAKAEPKAACWKRRTGGAIGSGDNRVLLMSYRARSRGRARSGAGSRV